MALSFLFSLCAICVTVAFADDPANETVVINLAAPRRCEPKNCLLSLSVQSVSNGFLFSLEAEDNQKYIAVALAQTAMMGDDAVCECIRDGNDVYFYHSLNTGPAASSKRNNTRVPIENSPDFLNETSSSSDGHFRCSFVRPARTVVGGRVYDLNNERYYVQIVSGTKFRGGFLIGGIRYHDRWATTLRAVSFVKNEGAYGTANNIVEVAQGNKPCNAASPRVTMSGSLLSIVAISIIQYALLKV